MTNNQLGYITSDPKNLGTALKISVRMKLPMLAKDSRIQTYLKALNISQTFRLIEEPINDDLDSSEDSAKESSIIEISSINTLGKSEVIYFLF